MKKVTMVTHSDYTDHITQELHRSGLMQIDTLKMERLEKRVPDRSVIEDISSRLHKIMGSIRHEESGNLVEQILHPKPPEIITIPIRTEKEIVSLAESVLPDIEVSVEEREGKLGELREKKRQVEDQRAEILPLRGMDFELSYLGETNHSYAVAGTTRDIIGLREVLDSELVHIHHQGTKDRYTIVIIAHHSAIPEVEKVRRQRYFDSVEVHDLKGTPREAIRALDTELIAVQGEIDDIEEDLHALYQRNRKELLVLEEELAVHMERKIIHENYGVTESTTTVTGWVEDGNEQELEEMCHNASDGHVMVHMEEPEGNDVPVKLRNPSWATPFEALVTTYAFPKYDELDPTKIVGPLFIILFALMLGDAGYGLLLLMIGLFMHFHVGKFSEKIRGYAYYVILMGFTTTIIGFLMGGLFYDSTQRLIRGNETLTLYPSFDMGAVSFPFDPMNEPVGMFLLSLFIGLIVLNIGIALAIIQSYRQKDYHDLVTNQLSWILLEPAGILLIGGKMLGAFQFGTVVTMAAMGLVIIGLLLRFLVSGGLLMFDITGFVGNVLSFARLLALALATAGLALTINIFVELIGGISILHLAPLFIIIAIIFFIVAHIFNTALQALGAAIHSLRLNYVELFSTFYSGGGEPFTPFSEERTFTKQVDRITEEIV